MATNRIETLDPALIRPGRIDRKIEFPLPDIATRRMVFRIHTQRMALTDDVDLEEFISSKDDLSGADIKAIWSATTTHNTGRQTGRSHVHACTWMLFSFSSLLPSLHASTTVNVYFLYDASPLRAAKIRFDLFSLLCSCCLERFCVCNERSCC